MALSKVSDFYERVWAVVREVPAGRVTTYGAIARHLETKSARAVGWALKAAVGKDPLDVPCHRVVNREGRLTGARHFATPTAMAERLRAEGVAFAADDRVEIDAYLWEPEVEL